jgi:hypothetical protein
VRKIANIKYVLEIVANGLILALARFAVGHGVICVALAFAGSAFVNKHSRAISLAL